MSQPLKAGIAKANITPPVGYSHQGYSGVRKGCVGVHDALFAKVLFLKNGEDRLVIITGDLFGIAIYYICHTIDLVNNIAYRIY